MNRNKKSLHKAAANVLGVTLTAALATGVVAETSSSIPVFAAQQEMQELKKIIYLNGSIQADETADGSSQAQAVDSFEKAVSLAGGQGTIVVCGTVKVDTEKELYIPAGIKIKRNDGFTGDLVKITEKGTLTVIGEGITEKDVDIEGMEDRKEAFAVAKIPQLVIPSQITLNNLAEWNMCSFPFLGFVGEGTFAWEGQVMPSSYETDMKVVFTPFDTENYDYSLISGWDSQSKKITRNIKVVIESLKPQEEKVQKSVAEVQIPSELKFATREEFKNLDFVKNGFVGEGTFAWEKQVTPFSYETKLNIIFTPSDIEKYDYTQVEGWNSQTQKVVREVKIFIEEFKEDIKENTKEDIEEDNIQDTVQDTVQDTGEDKVPSTVEDTQKDVVSSETPQTEVEQAEAENPKSEIPQEGSSTKTEAEISPEESDVQIEYVNPDEVIQTEPESQNEVAYEAEEGKNGELAQEIPVALPVGSLIDETGVQVSGDFIPYYVDLQVTYNEAVNELPDAGIGEILSAYELKLWDLKEDKEYQLPKGKKVKVMIPLPENANCFSDLSIAHYLGNNQYEYFVFSKDGKNGNMTVEEKNEVKYLTFETSSFSPFNVGGHQIVGLDIKKGNSLPAIQEKEKSSVQSTEKKQPQQKQSQQKQSQQKQPQQKTWTKKSTPIVQTVKTGDETKTMTYVLLGFGAFIIAGVAIFFGRKKK